MSKINKIKGRQVFDSRGNPTIEVEIFSKNLSASAICPSGASTGTYEAYEKRDLEDKRYLGKGVNKSVNIINPSKAKIICIIILNLEEIPDELLFFILL